MTSGGLEESQGAHVAARGTLNRLKYWKGSLSK